MDTGGVVSVRGQTGLVLSSDNLVVDNCLVIQVDHGLVVLCLGLATNDIVEHLGASCRSRRRGRKLARVLKLEEPEHIGLGWFPEVVLAEEEDRARVSCPDDVPSEIGLLNGESRQWVGSSHLSSDASTIK